MAIVTGASRGIGKQTALLLAERGVQLVLAARTELERPSTPGTLGQTADELQAVGADPVVVRADVGVQADLDRIVATALDRFGRVDILVNNAAYTVGRTLFTHVPDLTREQWEKHFAVNVTAPLMLIQGCWPSMVANGGGVVVNLTSGASLLRPVAPQPVGSTGLPENGPAYGASKAALNRMVNVIAQEGLPHRIAVVCVDPGFVLTETMAATFARTGVQETATIPPSVPAQAIAHLCTCEEPMRYTGQIVSGPELVERLAL
ncbi:MAG TPA: SDR family oxidoreductase [Acidimicrobiales bacterium]|nr:SDR family oxidoreductase [Acidimicrobiales bacterium]